MQAKMSRDFTKAETFRDELKAMGVDLDDKQGTWTARRGAAQSRERGGDGDRARAVGADRERMEGAASAASKVDTSRGHDYRRADDGRVGVDEPCDLFSRAPS